MWFTVIHQRCIAEGAVLVLFDSDGHIDDKLPIFGRQKRSS